MLQVFHKYFEKRGNKFIHISLIAQLSSSLSALKGEALKERECYSPLCFRCVTETGSRGKMAAAVKMLKAHKEEEQQIDYMKEGL